MDYDRIILELLNRISVLEERVNNLENSSSTNKKNTAATSKKYRYLADYLHNTKEEDVKLTFAEIEQILKDKLPSSAYQHRAFWANTESHSIAISWMSVGYQTVEVDLANRYVVFEKRREY